MWSNNVILVFLTLLLLSLVSQPVHGLSCFPACPTDLTLKQQRCGPCPRDCKFGIVLDLCGCCRVCGKGPGESCIWQFGGNQCGDGLKCEPIVENGVPTPQGKCAPK